MARKLKFLYNRNYKMVVKVKTKIYCYYILLFSS